MALGAPLFSIVVPTFGRAEFLARSLESVAAQTIEDFECWVVDDAGPEPVQAVDDPRFRVIRRQTNGGQAAAINTGIRAAVGRYLAFLDDDDQMLPERLEIALEGLREAPVALCLSRAFGDGARSAGARPRRVWNGDVSRSIREDMTPNVGQTAVERERVVLFDESLRASADVEWWIRLARDNRVKTIEKPGHLYRVHGGARHGNPGSARVEALARIHELHREYFEENPRASAFHLRRIGLCALGAGRPGDAARWLLRSLRRRPHPKTAWHLSRALAARLRG